MNENDREFAETLKTLLSWKGDVDIASKTGSKVVSEILGYRRLFNPEGHIDGTSEKYVKNELDWYLSQDLNINGHPGIGTNKVWKACATEDGHVNSNYGWCLFSKENEYQYSHAMNELYKNPETRQAVMIYTRPSIHEEKDDGVHARYDMLCTMYTMLFIRKNVLHMHVHMRSNDVWTGLRNDLAWQQYVYDKAYKDLNNGLWHGALSKGHIMWVADSMHLYERNLEDAEKWLRSHE